MKKVHIFTFIFILFASCKENGHPFTHPIIVNVSLIPNENKVDSSAKVFQVTLKNNSLPYLTVEKRQDFAEEPYYMHYDHIDLFGGALDKIYVYRGPYSIPERLPRPFIDTIYRGVEKKYMLDKGALQIFAFLLNVAGFKNLPRLYSAYCSKI